MGWGGEGGVSRETRTHSLLPGVGNMIHSVAPHRTKGYQCEYLGFEGTYGCTVAEGGHTRHEDVEV